MERIGNIILALDDGKMSRKSHMILIYYMIVVALIPRCSGEESVFITVLNPKPLKANDGPVYQCYQTSDESTPRTYGRYVNTRAGSNLNLAPNDPTTHRQQPNAQIITLPTTDGNGFGIFFCRGTQSNKVTSTIPTVLLRNDAKLHPKGGFFTKTVTTGDMDVTLEVERANNDNTNKAVAWIFNDGTDVIFSSTFTHTISGAVSKANEGVYEAFLTGERNDGRHAIMRLIVKDCPANRWGPPGCYGICDKCYNGGVCDENSGKCICPPGFMGDNCLTSCGGNSFGKNCEFTCSTRNPGPDACNTPQFCLPDPYGCTCNTGFHTLDCENYCPTNKFGAGCTQDCRCTLGTCNRQTGVCEGNNNVCRTGWSGESCQIPDVCESDYYGSQCTQKCHCLNGAACNKNTGQCPNRQCAAGYNSYDGTLNCEECRGSTFGNECIGVCRCDISRCNKVTGECNGGCLTNWVQPDCQTGIQSLSNTKVNPNQHSVFTCIVTGPQVPSRETVILERQGGGTNGVTFKSTSLSVDLSSRSVLFDVDSVSRNEQMICRLMFQQGSYLSILSSTFVLPVLSLPPQVNGVAGLSADIEWDEWNNNTNVGDPPIVAYRVHYKTSDTSTWESMSINGQSLNTTVTGLRWETEYVFSISAVRTGEGGEGPRGPSSTPRSTTCAGPLQPQGLMASSSLDAPKQISLQWQEPDADTIRCSTGITEFLVYYRPRNGGTTTQKMTVDPSKRTVNISGLEVYTEYRLQMAMRNNIGTGAMTAAVYFYSPEEEPPAPMRPIIMTTTLESITLSLKAAEPHNLNGRVKSYEIEYQKINPEMGNIQAMHINAVSGELSVETTIQNLTQNSNYSIRVQIVNGAGVSPWSIPVNAMTVNVEKAGQTDLGVGGTVGIVIGFLVLIILIAVLIVFVLRKRESQKKLPPISYMGSNHGQTNTTFENSVIDLTVPEPNKKDKFANGNTEENTYANAAIINHINEGNRSPNRPQKPLPNTKAAETPIPVAAVRPSLQKTTKPEPTEYENVTLSQHPPIPVSELETYIKERKKTNSFKQEYALIPKDKMKPWEVASKQENKAKNRFKNIIAYDHSRVVLEPIAGDPHSDYYNACYIQNHKDEKSFIASQGPNSASVNDFWRMIWQEHVGTIVMVTQLIENGKEKCRKYWPEPEGHAEVYGNLQVTLLDTEFFSDYSVRTLKLQQVNGDEVRSLKQYNFFSWPDMGVPLYPTAVLQFVRSVKAEYNRQHLHSGVKSPILVHCSAGVGRTGTFISVYTQLEKMATQATVDVFNFVKRMRESRINMVQTAEQYMFVYNALLESHLSGNTAIPVNEYSEQLLKMKRINSKTRHTYIEEEFKTLNSISPLPDPEMFRGGRLPENDNKNRYQEILPMERNRPFLIVDGIQGSTNYINAAFVDSFKKKDAFITTQMPLPNTHGDIWRMVWDWKCCGIVMLNELDETDPTCQQYWPNDYDSLEFGPLVIDSLSSESNEYFTCRKLQLNNIHEPSAPVFLNQFQLQGWPSNQDKPDSPLCLLTLLDAVENWQRQAKSKGPVIVQCMNGIGRSGVFCTISTVREKLKRDSTVDIFQSIKRLRMNHPKMVETLDQYTLCYETMQEFFTQFDDYANFR